MVYRLLKLEFLSSSPAADTGKGQRINVKKWLLKEQVGVEKKREPGICECKSVCL